MEIQIHNLLSVLQLLDHCRTRIILKILESDNCCTRMLIWREMYKLQN